MSDLFTLTAANGTQPIEKAPFELPFRKEIGEGMSYSRCFVQTYNLLLGSLLLFLTLLHHIHLPHRHPHPDSELGPAHLRSPSLSEHHSLLPRRRSSYPLLLRLRGVLRYQPPNILSFETPPVGTLLLLTAYYTTNIFYVFYNIPFHRLKFFILAHRLSCVFTPNLPFLYLTAAKSPLLRKLTGWDYARINILHRAVGRVCILAITAHVWGFIYVWYATLQANLTLKEYLLFPKILAGEVAWVGYVLLGATSLEVFRRRWYEVFLGMHVLMQALCLGCMWYHHGRSQPYVLAAVIIFALDRVYWRLWHVAVRARGVVRVLADGATVEVVLRPPKGYVWEAGDHVFLCIPALEWLHPHPFSIANMAEEGVMRLLIRAREGFSQRLLEDVRQMGGEKEVVAVLDGPYGGDAPGRCVKAADVVVGIAGGSGVAVVWPLVKEAAEKEEHKRVVFVWIVREEGCVRTWMPEGAMEELRRMEVEVVIKTTQGKPRPDLSAMLEGMAERREGRLGVIVCGPQGMVRTVRNSGARLMRHGWDVDVVTEKFGW